MILETYNKKINNFLLDLEEELKCYNVEFIISALNYVKDGNVKCNGYFDGRSRELAISIGKPLDKWLHVLVHESCHFDQWKENCEIWSQCDRFDDNYGDIDSLLQEKSKSSKIKIKKYFYLIRDLELDCEKRAVKKIKELKLPLNIERYCKKANAYVLFYNYMAIYNRWYKIGKEPYNNKQILNLMQSNFDIDYTKLNKKLIQLFHSCTK